MVENVTNLNSTNFSVLKYCTDIRRVNLDSSLAFHYQQQNTFPFGDNMWTLFWRLTLDIYTETQI